MGQGAGIAVAADAWRQEYYAKAGLPHLAGWTGFYEVGPDAPWPTVEIYKRGEVFFWSYLDPASGDMREAEEGPFRTCREAYKDSPACA